MNLKKEIFLVINLDFESCTKVQAYTVKEAIAKVFDLDEWGEDIEDHISHLDSYEYNTWANRNQGYVIVMLPKK